MSLTSGGFDVQQLLELLEDVSVSPDEFTAIQVAVERAAQALEAEVSGLVVGGRVVRSVGFRLGSGDEQVLAAVAAGRDTWVEVPGVGRCSAGAAGLGRGEDSQLVLARHGQDFTAEEYNLIRGMARLLGLTLRMLRTIDAERRRQRLMRRLYAVQRGISRRLPLAQVLEMIVAGAHDMLADHDGAVALWLEDHSDPSHMTLTASVAITDEQAEALRRIPVAGGGAAGLAVSTDTLQLLADDMPEAEGGFAPFDPDDPDDIYSTRDVHRVQSARHAQAGLDAAGGGADAAPADEADVSWRHTMAAPVHENGVVAGAILVGRSSGRDFTASDQEKLLSFAEHVTLALTDARTVREMNAARHDSLTGLPSRALFLDHLAEELVRGGRAGSSTALLFIDLDRFKQVNDLFGHASGDVLLSEVAERIRGLLRSRDVASRFGGDEFAVMLGQVSDLWGAVEVADRLVEALAEPFEVPGGLAQVGGSIGIAFSGLTGPGPEELVRHADVAMYHAKRAGRGRSIVFDPSMDREHGSRAVARPEG